MSLFHNPHFWLVVGFGGQGLFTLRFLVQWLASERSGEVVVPTSFWWLSLAGAAAVLAYGISRLDPVLIVGQSTGSIVYARNLALGKGGRKAPPEPPPAATPAPRFNAVAAAEPVRSRA